APALAAVVDSVRISSSSRVASTVRPRGGLVAVREPYARTMAQGPDAPAGYDWEDGPVPDGPEPLALPAHHCGTPADGPAGGARPADPPGEGPMADGTTSDVPREVAGPYGAPSFTYDPQRAPEEPRRRPALPAWAIVAIVLLQSAALVASVALVIGGIERITSRGPEAPTAAPSTEEATPSAAPTTSSPERRPGTVTDSAGREVEDGTGGYDAPATIGEHTGSWTAWTDGTIAVTALDVDLDATVPGAGGQDVVQDGYRLVLATYEVRYDGPGWLAPAEELWLTGESDRTYFPDIAEGLVDDPMKAVGPLQDGGTARFRSAFLIPEQEVGTFRLGVETYSGEILYFGTG